MLQFKYLGVEKFKYLGVVFTSGGRWSEEIDTRIGKANAVLRELDCSVESQNVSFQRPQSCQFLNRSLFRSSPAVVNLG